eukprot:13250-Heterococcus_DN1.PRE.2
MVDCVVFPAVGSRPHPSQLSGGDLDGDIYFVLFDDTLLPPPAQRTQVALDYDPLEKVEVDNVTVHHIEFNSYYSLACSQPTATIMVTTATVQPLCSKHCHTSNCHSANMFASMLMLHLCYTITLLYCHATTHTHNSVCNMHFVAADRSPKGVHCPPCLELAALASTAVDFAKTGVPAKFPAQHTLCELRALLRMQLLLVIAMYYS